MSVIANIPAAVLSTVSMTYFFFHLLIMIIIFTYIDCCLSCHQTTEKLHTSRLRDVHVCFNVTLKPYYSQTKITTIMMPTQFSSVVFRSHEQCTYAAARVL